jgi:hypothetical protein
VGWLKTSIYFGLHNFREIADLQHRIDGDHVSLTFLLE